MTVNMSLLFFVSRLCTLILSLTVNALLVGLSTMALALQTGGGYEILSTVLHLFGVLLVCMRTIYVFRVAEQGALSCLVFDGSIWSLNFMACTIITVRATHQSGFVRDYSALSDARSVADAVLALSWAAFSLAFVALVLDVLEPPQLAGCEITPLTSPPPRHRVVFHDGRRPLKIIEIPQQTYWGKHGKTPHPRAPEPAYSGVAERYPVRSKSSYSMV